MLTKPFKPLALAFLVNLIISVEDKIKYNITMSYLLFTGGKKEVPGKSTWQKGKSLQGKKRNETKEQIVTISNSH